MIFPLKTYPKWSDIDPPGPGDLFTTTHVAKFCKCVIVYFFIGLCFQQKYITDISFEQYAKETRYTGDLNAEYNREQNRRIFLWPCYCAAELANKIIHIPDYIPAVKIEK